jgi:hypothetical protein
MGGIVFLRRVWWDRRRRRLCDDVGKGESMLSEFLSLLRRTAGGVALSGKSSGERGVVWLGVGDEISVVQLYSSTIRASGYPFYRFLAR